MDRNVKLGIVIALVITVIGGLIYFNYQNDVKEATPVGKTSSLEKEALSGVIKELQKEEEKKEKERNEKMKIELPKFVKEHNATIAKKAQKTKKKIVENPDGTKREVLPYTKELPPMPDEEENNATLFGVDSNDNGVRDDLEILAVKMFGKDRDLTEAVFSGVRANSYDIYLAKKTIEQKKGYISDEDIQQIRNDISVYIDCISYYGGMSENILSKSKKFDSYYDNTPERKKMDRIIMNNLRGGGEDPDNITDKFCKDYIEKTKTYEFSN